MDFIEAHHIFPIKDMDESKHVTQVKDLKMVCSNCHSMLHSPLSKSSISYLTVEELAQHIKAIKE